MVKYEEVVEVEPSVKQLGDEPKVTLHLDRDPNDPRVPRRTVLKAFKKGEVLKSISNKELTQ